MAAVSHVTVWRPRDGQTDRFLAGCQIGKAIHEKYGATVYLTAQTAGKEPSSYSYMMVFESASKYGTFGEALFNDPDWIALVAEGAKNPAADVISQSTYREIQL